MLQEKGLSINLGIQRVSLDGRKLRLTSTEFHMLAFLAINQGRVLSLEAFLREVWRMNYFDENGYHTVRAAMYRLRGKLGETSRSPVWIGLCRGEGYFLLQKAKVLEKPLLKVIAQVMEDGSLERASPY